MNVKNRVPAVAGTLPILTTVSVRATGNGASSTASGLHAVGADFTPPATPNRVVYRPTAFYTNDIPLVLSGNAMPIHSPEFLMRRYRHD